MIKTPAESRVGLFSVNVCSCPSEQNYLHAYSKKVKPKQSMLFRITCVSNMLSIGKARKT